jgi:16S rRNA U516 pseudouridylate synthase RsuA-like enzyme
MAPNERRRVISQENTVTYPFLAGLSDNMYSYEQTWILVDLDGEPYASAQPGTLGGRRRSRIYGRLDCPAALRAIAQGGYVLIRKLCGRVGVNVEKARRVRWESFPLPSLRGLRTSFLTPAQNQE